MTEDPGSDLQVAKPVGRIAVISARFVVRNRGADNASFITCPLVILVKIKLLFGDCIADCQV